MSCERGIDVGAYLLGAMAEDERTVFAAHLEGCDACREEVARLRPAVDALPLSAPAIAPPPELRERIMAVVRSEAELLRAAGPEADRVPAPARRHRRWLRPAALRPLPLATLACALVALAIGIAALAGGGGSPVRTVDASVSFPGAPRASAQLRLGSGGASLRVEGVPAPPAGKVYEVWLQRGTSAPEPTDALFTVGDRGDASVNVPDLHGVSKVMVTAEPAGGSPHPTGRVVIVAAPA
ncbi:MAG TPA: anti-sigma factor [Solirubrobacteraceae bacterium]|nr:anti-sigma factor [Solirubrobacteraceae bacterium]